LHGLLHGVGWRGRCGIRQGLGHLAHLLLLLPQLRKARRLCLLTRLA
jgi:hypothetical protein